jgi:hypothetical protein
MKWLILISALCIAFGIGLVAYAITMPVYTDVGAYNRFDDESWHFIMSESRPSEGEVFSKYRSQMRAIETPHIKLSDLGRGLCAVGIGGFIARGIWISYYRQPANRTFKALRRIWIILWAIRVPFASWYFSLRMYRGDFPSWDDAIILYTMGVAISSAVGATLSSIFLSRLFKGRRFPEKVSFEQPDSKIEWVRLMIFVMWFVVLGVTIIQGIADGNEGDVLTCTAAVSVLLIFLSAKPEVSSVRFPDTCQSMEADPSTGSG